MRPSGVHTHPGDAGWAVAVVVGLVVLAVAGAAVKAVESIPWWVWAVVPFLALAVIGGVVVVIVRVWRAEAATYAARMRERQVLPKPAQRVSPRPAAPALPPVEQHLHFHDVSAAEVAEILASRNHEGDQP